jgi:hypothetical protein
VIRFFRTHALICCLVVAGLLLFQPSSFGSDELTKKSGSFTSARPIRDIRMRDGGMVLFHVLDAAGSPVPGQVVTVSYQGNTVATALSNEVGQIQVNGLRPGIHVLASGHAGLPLRFWNAQVAPPSAASSTAIVVTQPIVRGQYGAPMIGPGMLATGAAVAGVVGVIAGKNSTNESTPVSPVGGGAAASSGGPASP